MGPGINEVKAREEFLQLMQAYSNESLATIHEFQEHMINATLMGYLKDEGLSTFGPVKDKNLEHPVNIASYAMVRYTTMQTEGIVYPVPEYLAGKGLRYETPDDLIKIAVEALYHYAHPQEGTDSIVTAKPKTAHV